MGRSNLLCRLGDCFVAAAPHNDDFDMALANTASYNGLNGICLSDSAMPLLEENSSRHNDASAIVYYVQSGGEARGNDCSLNGREGIAVQGQAQPPLEGNGCFGNGEMDIAYFESADSLIRFAEGIR